jgi:hypothetical protein
MRALTSFAVTLRGGLKALIAGACHKAGCESVILTPRSGDHGRDVIAVKKRVGIVRVINQVFLPIFPLVSQKPRLCLVRANR